MKTGFGQTQPAQSSLFGGMGSNTTGTSSGIFGSGTTNTAVSSLLGAGGLEAD